jgi:CHAD domain-containing protein
MGDVLGAVRDIDVLDTRFESGGPAPGGSPGVDELRSRLASQRRGASEDLAEVLRSERYLTLLDRLDAGASLPRFYSSPESEGAGVGKLTPSASARTALPLLLRPHWKKLRRRVKKAGARPSDTQLHKIRIGSKQLRYGAELAVPVLGKTAARTARRAEDIQTLLGEHHDAVTAVEWLERIPAEGTTAASFAAGYEAADALRQQTETRRQWTRAWHRLRNGSVTDWLQ